jgi:hypothetical protein
LGVRRAGRLAAETKRFVTLSFPEGKPEFPTEQKATNKNA